MLFRSGVRRTTSPRRPKSCIIIDVSPCSQTVRRGASEADVRFGASSPNSISPAFGASASRPRPQEVDMPTYTDHSSTNVRLRPLELAGELVPLVRAFLSRGAPPDPPKPELGIFFKSTPRCFAHDDCQPRVPPEVLIPRTECCGG